MGMIPNDIGYIADPDETFSREFLRAVQVCDDIAFLDYDLHNCEHSKVSLLPSRGYLK
jgi:hypothetical protein